MAVLAERRGCQQRFRLFLPGLPAVGGENVHWLSSQLKQETRQAERQIRISIESELPAMYVRVRIGDSIHKPATLFPDRVRDRFARKARDLYQESIRRFHADGMIEGNCLLPGCFNHFQRLLGAELLHG